VDYREYRPAPDLELYVDRYWRLMDVTPSLEPVLPDGHSEIVFHLGSPVEQVCKNGTVHRQSGAVIIGQQLAPVRLRATGPVNVWGIRFRPAGARAFIHCDQRELTGHIIDAGAIDAREELGNAKSDLACVRSLNSWLRSTMRPFVDPRVTHAVNLLSLPNPTSIVATADAIGWSRRQLERAFEAAVGLSPRTYARISRFQYAVRLRNEAPSRTWADIAAEACFTDQSHMIADFRRFGGATPGVLLDDVAGISAAMLRA
jgi:AraC-like DNA-binding protein